MRSTLPPQVLVLVEQAARDTESFAVGADDLPTYNSGPMAPAHRAPGAPLEERLREFWALFDAKDYEALLAMMTDDAMETDDFAKVMATRTRSHRQELRSDW